ncbi:MAG: DUF2254 domain-containing protein [Rhodobacteraceae bacterium]|nr:MAG: DUF2254 domain-containing protein [Paracoccaceae bacterium]
MISKVVVLARRIWRKLWVRVVLLSLSSLLALALAPLLTPFLPEDIKLKLGREAILPVLTILASGMLAVTTFSLNVMVSAFRTAANMATPRVYRLLLEDTVTQSVLATFVGGFVYSLSAVILFHARVYSEDAAVVVFAITILVVALIVLAILRWIDHLESLGSMDQTLRLIENRTRFIMARRAERPCLGARRGEEGDVLPESARLFVARKSGYIRFIDISKLNSLAKEAGTDLHITRVPGDFVLRDQPLGSVNIGDDGLCTAAARAFDIGDVRSFDQDPTFGLTLLAETAQRALSPGVNDPGTAVEVLGRLERLLWEEVPATPTAAMDRTPDFPHVTLSPVHAERLLACALRPIARDGAEDPDVMGRMAQVLESLAAHPNPDMAEAAGKMRDTLAEA